MIIYPAIDLKDGKCVRLLKGDFATVHQVAEDPVETARVFREAGAEWIHMVDLDGRQRRRKEKQRDCAGGLSAARAENRAGRRHPLHGGSGEGIPAGSQPVRHRLCGQSLTRRLCGRRWRSTGTRSPWVSTLWTAR